jgi:hypothetical protein
MHDHLERTAPSAPPTSPLPPPPAPCTAAPLPHGAAPRERAEGSHGLGMRTIQASCACPSSCMHSIKQHAHRTSTMRTRAGPSAGLSGRIIQDTRTYYTRKRRRLLSFPPRERGKKKSRDWTGEREEWGGRRDKSVTRTRAAEPCVSQRARGGGGGGCAAARAPFDHWSNHV